jgi:cytochrome c biogenesis protein CcmG/thiol:disulfide interchange protein DsbE
MEVAMRRLTFVAGLLILLSVAGPPVFAAGLFKVGEKAPTFTLPALAGETVSLDSYRGKIVVLGLFHICQPCMTQGTALQKVYESTRGKNVAVIGVNSAGNSKTDVGEFLSAFPVKITYPYLLDLNKTTDKLYGGGRFIPNVYVIDGNGIIRWQRVGEMDLAAAEVIVAEVEKLLAGGTKM